MFGMLTLYYLRVYLTQQVIMAIAICVNRVQCKSLLHEGDRGKRESERERESSARRETVK